MPCIRMVAYTDRGQGKNEMHRKRNEVLRQVSQALSVQVIDCYGESGISQFSKIPTPVGAI